MMLLSCTGNEKIHLLTTSGKRQILRIELEDWDGNVRYAEYDNFRVESEYSNYKLRSLGRYSGNAGQ